MEKLRKQRRSVATAAILVVFAIWIWWGNTALEVNEYEIADSRIPQSFDGFRIAQISDLHNAQFGEDNCKLIGMLSGADPDIIVLTGDLIDSRNTDIEIALEFARSAMEIAPVYYVTGNHESRVPEYDTLRIGLEEAGVEILANRKIELTRAGACVTLVGIDDPSLRTAYLPGDEAPVIASALDELLNASDGYTILLSHRPELFEVYVESRVGLVFSGHAHGGQFRLPLIGGLVAPNQGLFPEYDAGLFRRENTTMIVSRGVGSSMIPVRFCNRPEIVVVELKIIKETGR